LLLCCGCFQPKSIDAEIKKFIQEAGAGKSKVQCLSPEDYLALTRKAYDEGNYLDSLLAWLEGKFQYGKEIPGQEERRLLPKIKSDPDLELCLQLSLGIRPHDEKGIITNLDHMKRADPSRGHVLDLLKASELTRQGDYEKAKKLLLGVLKANPYLTKAYRLLGEIYAKTGPEEMKRLFPLY
jgi:predicted Zn-dependent protease